MDEDSLPLKTQCWKVRTETRRPEPEKYLDPGGLRGRVSQKPNKSPSESRLRHLRKDSEHVFKGRNTLYSSGHRRCVVDPIVLVAVSTTGIEGEDLGRSQPRFDSSPSFVGVSGGFNWEFHKIQKHIWGKREVSKQLFYNLNATLIARGFRWLRGWFGRSGIWVQRKMKKR